MRRTLIALAAPLALAGCAGSPLSTVFTPTVVAPVVNATVTATGLQSAVSKACGFVGTIGDLAGLITSMPLLGTIGDYVSAVCNGLTKSASRKSGAPATSIVNGMVIRGHWK